MKDARFYYSTPTVMLTAEVVDWRSQHNHYDINDVVQLIPTTKKRTPRVTICSLLDTEANTLSFGVAVCSPKDIFKKSIGRELALKRATENPIKVVTVDKSNIRYIRERVCQELEWDALYES